ncbi:hypothetical protein I315_04420 [Cryptococcus gattii Ru294]|nr:hypothetical protein I315_04420 [Cryptococcus gattii Ru294]
MSHPNELFPRMDWYRRENCVTCNDTTPTCNCSSSEKCILSSRTCSQCPTIQCIAKSSSSGGSSVNAGAIAGPIVGALVIASLGLFWWMRRKKRRDLKRVEELAERARKAESAGFQLSPADPPAPVSAHSQPPNPHGLPLPPPSASRRSPLPPAPVNAEYYDENGATIRVYSTNGTINADPNGDPFSDRQSISTMGSGGTANIIPIQWIPPSNSEDGLSKIATRPGQSAAARALDQARQNLFKPGAAPTRPARSPDLDLRLNPPSSFDSKVLESSDTNAYRDSYLSGNSAAPSYFSGQSDLNIDAPKIVTSKQVQVGRLQQAEMVQFGGKSAQMMEVLGGSFVLESTQDGDYSFDQHPAERGIWPAPGLSPSDASFRSGRTGEAVRTLTPVSRKFDEEERLESGSTSPGDLRFSMGSLAYRDSTSTMDTSRYLTSAITVAVPTSGVSPTLLSTTSTPNTANPETRASVVSSKSYADSVLGAFPMIPPGSHHPPLPPNASFIANSNSHPHFNSTIHTSVPHSTSVDTLDRALISRPPPSYRPPPPGPRPPSSARGSTAADLLREQREKEDGEVDEREEGAEGKKKRPETQASVADSLLGSFPFVPPNVDDLAGLPSPSQGN